MPRPPKQPGVYLLHFDRPISPHHTTQHYLGWAADIPARLACHASNPDARLLQVARERGIGFRLARVWDGADRQIERRLKNRAEAPALCPICNPHAARLACNPNAGRPRRQPLPLEEIAF